MADLISLAFDDALVRAVMRGGEPWFVGVDVCSCLGLARPHTSLDLLDDDERASHTVGGGGGERAAIIISEPGVYRLVFRSRKPEAERFKRWLAHDVLPQLRKSGRYASDQPVSAPSPFDVKQEPLLHRLHLVREARAIHGREVAKVMWRQLGLPLVPPPPPSALDEARQCLRQLLDAIPPGGTAPMREHLQLAMDEAEHDRLLVMCAGVRPSVDGEGFMVANFHPFLDGVYRGTEWARGRHMRVLRRLPGTAAGGTIRFAAHQRRATLIPGDYLDDEFNPRKFLRLSARRWRAR